MDGSALGSVTAAAYFLLFQAAGVIFAFAVLEKENTAVRFFFGTVFGSTLYMWIPTVFSLFFQFTVTAHLCGAAVTLAAASILYVKKKPSVNVEEIETTFKRHRFLLCISVMLCFFVYLILHSFRITDGKIYCSQATYGDMSMHLGFITSIANQGVFPPEYSILPGTRLSYPFLADTNSSSLYLMGASLRFAYVWPMILAGAQVFFGFYLFAYNWLKDKLKAAVAWVFVFFCGGFGFIYFIDGSGEKFKKIFTGFYSTPTNHAEESIRWVNVVVDMLLPQRATLFGWALLIPTMYLIYRGVFEEKKSYFLISGILLSLMPMIHTHSFLFAGMLCAAWLMVSLRKRKSEEKAARIIKIFMVIAVFSVAQLVEFARKTDNKHSDMMLYIGILGLLPIAIYAVLLVIRSCRENGVNSLLSTWGLLLLPVVILALPQLMFWTFPQTAGNVYFLTGTLNWVNYSESYFSFYLKNMGLVIILFPFAVCYGKREQFFKIMPAMLVWFAAEFICFQPNEYDNNKLFYPAFMLICCFTADFVVDLLRRVSRKTIRNMALALGMTISVFSAVLTMGREAVSSYILFDREAYALAEFAETLPSNAVFLTSSKRHNNPIAALAGRNIVCGSSAYLLYHGLDYSYREAVAARFYANPKANAAFLEENRVEYIVLGDEERSDYTVDEESIESLYTCVFKAEDISLYRVRDIRESITEQY